MIENQIKTTCIILALNRSIENSEICHGNDYQLDIISDPLHLQIGTYTLSKEIEEDESLLQNSVFYRLLTKLELIDALKLTYGIVSTLNINLKRKDIYKINFIGSYKNEKPNKKFRETTTTKTST